MFLDNFKIDLLRIKNARLGEYVLTQNEIKEWSVAIVSNTDSDIFIDFKGGSKKGDRGKNTTLKTYEVKIGNENIELGCSVRNQQLLREGEYYLISKNLAEISEDIKVIDSAMKNNNILLNEGATIDTKPQLEIFADDVKCSHGCTVGQLNDDALFYLRARGISKKEAQALLLYAFANDAMQNIDIEPLKLKVSKLLAEKLEVNIEF